MQFRPRSGGAERYIPANPGAAWSPSVLVGAEAMVRMANHHRIGPHVRRVSLAPRWRALMLRWQGSSIAHRARTLRATDVTVRNHIHEGPAA